MAVDVDTVLLNLSEKGFFQVTQFIAACISMVPVAVSLLKIVFIGFVPKSKCAELNITQLYEYGYENNDTHNIQYGACHIHIFSLTGDGTNHTLSCINGYSYEENKDLSFVSEWDLVCGKAGLSELTQTLYSVGGLVGSLTMPYFSDTRGRKPILVISNILILISSISSSLSSNYYAFVVFRLLEGLFTQGLLVSAYTLMLELFPVKNRTLMCGMTGVTWGICVLPLAPIAYLLRNYSWRVNVQVFCIFHAMALFHYWYLEESIRWLLNNGDLEKSKKIIKRAAKENKVDFDTVWENSVQTTVMVPLNIADDNENRTLEVEITPKNAAVKQEGFHTIFKDPLARVLTLIIFINGLMNSLTYNGLYMTSHSLAGNRFLNFTLVSFTEILGNTTMAILLFRLQRRVTMALFQGLSGVALFVAVTVTYLGDGSKLYSILNTIFSLFGMFGISASYCVIWLYAPEIYPTNLRNIGLGFLTLSGNMGNMVSPYSRLLMTYIAWLPGTIFSFGCLGCLTLLYFMPESKSMQMPMTMDDVREQLRKQKKSRRKQSLAINESNPATKDV
ncbi:organic cation transporter protein-like [Octopus sinensis]|uniref:Organic cation transporter protein-like n=1 Tax=Octopus sinensis TaxID=2607531 RepID=A0A7E6F7H1_9MOLL|nr:organic cation transporter protein-like [Octopus sinensis]XP_036362917.1 organic cation transporter protein-like [Octopus sinensis]